MRHHLGAWKVALGHRTHVYIETNFSKIIQEFSWKLFYRTLHTLPAHSFKKMFWDSLANFMNSIYQSGLAFSNLSLWIISFLVVPRDHKYKPFKIILNVGNSIHGFTALKYVSTTSLLDKDLTGARLCRKTKAVPAILWKI